MSIRPILRPDPILEAHPFRPFELFPVHRQQPVAVLRVELFRPSLDGAGKLTGLVAQRLVHLSEPFDLSRLYVGLADDVGPQGRCNAEPLLALVPCRLHGDPPRDVPKGSDDDRALVGLERAEVDLEWNRATVSVHPVDRRVSAAHLTDLERVPVASVLRQLRYVQFAGDQALVRPPHQLARAIPEHPFRLAIDERDLPIGPHRDDCIGSLLDELPEPGVAGARCRLGTFSLGDIDQKSADDGWSAVESIDRDDIVQPQDLSTGGDHPVFELVGVPFLRGLLAEAHRLVPIVGMHMSQPEVGLIPSLDGIAEQPHRLRPYVGEGPRARIRLPLHDAGGLEQAPETRRARYLLRVDCIARRGVGRRGVRFFCPSLGLECRHGRQVP